MQIVLALVLTVAHNEGIATGETDMATTTTEKRRIYISHEENMKYFGGKLATWRTPFCYIERAVTPMQDPDGLWDECAHLKTPSGVVVVLDGEDIVSTLKA